MCDNGSENHQNGVDGTSGNESFYLDRDWFVQPNLNRISHLGEDHRVPNKFMQVLVCLAERPGVVTRQELLDAVWPDSIVVEESLSRAIYELRKIFQDDPKQPRFIETIPKKGYRLIAAISSHDAEVPDSDRKTDSAQQSPVTAADAAPEPDHTGQKPKRPKHRGLISSAIIVLITIVLVGQVVEWGGNQSPVWDETDGTSMPSTLRLTSRPGKEFHPALSPKGDRLAYVWNGGRPETKAIFVQTVGEEQPLCLTEQQGWYYYPEWSHDSRHIIFARMAPEKSGLFMLPATGGVERKLLDMQHGALPATPSCSPDGRWLAYVAPAQPEGPLCLFRLSLETGQTEQLTTHTSNNHLDFRPRYSPDGTQLAFMHLEPKWVRIALMPADGGEVEYLQCGDRMLLDIAWSANGNTIIFAGHDGLWQMSLKGEHLRMLSASNTQIEDLTLARECRLLAYTQNSDQKNIWQFDVDRDVTDRSGQSVGTELIASSRYDGRPAFSPCGEQIVFVSNRSGSRQIWLAQADGTDPRQLTRATSRLLSVPIWSPDGRQLAYLAMFGGYLETYLIDIETERTRMVSDPDAREIAHCWSPDSRSLYLTSDRSGSMQLWKYRLDDGQYTQLTTDGCYKSLLSADGSRLLFCTGARDTLGIWSLPVGGAVDQAGVQKELFMRMPGAQLVDWCVGPDGIYYCYNERHFNEDYHFALYHVETGEHRPLFDTTSKRHVSFTVHPDGRTILFDRTTRFECDIVGIENY